MTEKKKMYVVFCEDNETYWCSYNTWSDQLRKATIFHSIKYANEVHKRYKELRLKNVEVRMEVVPDKPSNADRIRSMTDDELKKFICSMFKCEFCDFELGERCGLLNWLQMPAEVSE